jgi:hypothetical protein
MLKRNLAFRKIPGDLKIRTTGVSNAPQPRRPEFDSTLAIPVQPSSALQKHRLVAIGDSITQGFKSGAIYDTDLAWPTVVA